MNLIMLFPEELPGEDSIVELRDRRHEHLRTVHRVSVGDLMTVGVLNGQIGTGEVLDISDASTRLSVRLQHDPPLPPPLVLILALPRPKTLRRMIIAATNFGIKEIYLINSWRVDKSFWESPQLDEENLRRYMLLGLEQAKDTILPKIEKRRLFKPFAEDELPAILQDRRAFVAHPYATAECPREPAGKLALIVGPEGGLIDYEIEKLQDCGVEAVSLGQRILRVEAAIPALLGRLLRTF